MNFTKTTLLLAALLTTSVLTQKEILDSSFCKNLCKGCMENNPHHCTRCYETNYLLKGSCIQCDPQCVSPSHCTSTGCIKCKSGFYSAEIKGSAGVFKCFKKDMFRNINIPAIMCLVFSFLVYCGLKSLIGVKAEEENVVYKAALDGDHSNNVLDLRGKSALNQYFEEKVWEDLQ